MSGIKSAEVKHGLNKTIAYVRRQAESCNNAATSIGGVGASEFKKKRTEAKSSHDGVVRSLPAEVAKYLEKESGRWRALVRSHDEAYNAAVENARTASARDDSFLAQKSDCERTLAELDSAIERVQRSLRRKDANNNGWYCDEEDAEAQRIRQSAQGVAADMRRSVRLAEEAQALRRSSFTKFGEAMVLAREAQREYDRLVALGENRKEQERVKEENKRKALNLKNEIVSLRKGIRSLNYEKFGAECYGASVRKEIESVVNAIDAGRYEQSISAAEALKGKLERALEEIGSEQRRWEAAKASAEKALSDAREEIAKIDKDRLGKFSGEPASALDAQFDAISAAEESVRREDFAAAEKRLSAAVSELRRIAAKAEENEELFNRRTELAESIMQALYDSNYDTPCYYFHDEANELSDLCVVASAPGGVGDMKMRIGLDGKVKLEVANVAEGHENVCIEKIRAMQERMAENDDVRFDMTDWGRAANQNKVHLDVRQRQQMTEQTMQMQRSM